MSTDSTRLGKTMSFVLRHNPASAGLVLDANGWVGLDDLVSALSTTKAAVLDVVKNDSKKRYRVDGDRIRASQGHSVAVDLGLTPTTPPAVLYHGTPRRSLASIKSTGLDRRARHAVHLSDSVPTATAVGTRRGDAVLLAVDTAAMVRDGHVFVRSDNGVWLTDTVPWRYLKLLP